MVIAPKKWSVGSIRLASSAVVALLTSLALVGCDASDAESGPATDGKTAGAIVGGSTETGFPAVGALALKYPGFGYSGSFCTATLISSKWVLTAAHCVIEQDGFQIEPPITYFYVGSNANPNNFGSGPINGALYPAAQFYVHPSYNPNDDQGDYDIALVRLAAAVPSVTPYSINTSAMSGSWVNTVLTYVGFGVSNGAADTGGGIKRKTTLAISGLYDLVYASNYNGSNVCFGDSGGPGLQQVGGQWRVVGVNSSVAGAGADPCKGISVQTRVDVFSSWVLSTMDAPVPSCKQSPDICFCAAACMANGTCNNTACQTLDCIDVYQCMGECNQTDQGCLIDCYQGGTEDAQQKFDKMSICFSNKCGNLGEAAFQQCAETQCGAEIDQCLPPIGTGSATCEQVYDCFADCGNNEQACLVACYETGSATAQSQLDAMLACFDAECSAATGDAFAECVYANCESQISTCLPVSDCSLLGGDCGSGLACYPVSTAQTDCFETAGVASGLSCNPDATSVGLQCTDGHLCLPQQGGGGSCEQFCFADSDCSGGGTCLIPVFQNMDGVGVCNCVDQDLDSWCLPADCDDTSNQAYPGASEICDDGIDNDCDGSTDEGCGSGPCVDGDKDGSCEDDDCNDDDKTVYPGAAEKCGDSKDNDCDGLTDEDCEGCVDADDDQYCDDVDCDDSDADIHPGADEQCDDGVDNDCDGLTDEDCGTTECTDADDDGVCIEDDCDDSRFDVKPGATELCDGMDNNCDGAIDEGCNGGGGEVGDGGETGTESGAEEGGTGGNSAAGDGGDSGGGCSASGTQPAPMWIAGLALLWLRRRRRLA